jgi:hypothetical protein
MGVYVDNPHGIIIPKNDPQHTWNSIVKIFGIYYICVMVTGGKPTSEKEDTNLGSWKRGGLERMIDKATHLVSTGKRIDYISHQFLGLNYKEKTLIGDDRTAEKLTVDLSGVDCFTFLDYIESLRQSDSFPSFMANLRLVRYRSGIISFHHRNHFFSDWIGTNKEFVEDVTKKIGGCPTRSSRKTLNTKEDGTFYLPGIDPVERTIDYIPASAVDGALLRKCRTGDYIGVYTEAPGLDVSHVGIFIRHRNMTFLRHASSVYRKVIDQEFMGYLSGKPGFLILRPKNKKNGQ